MSLSLLITIGLAFVIVAVSAGITARSRGARPLVMGLGLAAIPVGAYLTGVTDLTINGVVSLVDWFQRTQFTALTAWGLGLAIGGLIVFAIGSFLPKRTRAAGGETPAPQQKAAPAKQEQRQVAAPGKPAAPSAQAAAPAAKPDGKAPAQKGLDPEDAEIEALLRKRGIM